MFIPRSIIGHYYSESSFPPFPCPMCFHNLTPRSEHQHYVPTQQSVNLYDMGAIDPDGLQGHFHHVLGCTNNRCDEKVIVVGAYRVEEDRDHPDTQQQHYTKILRPVHFYPALPLFKIPEETPNVVKDGLNGAFSHAFSDASATGNALRRAVERLLDELGVAKTDLINHRRKRLTLHNRIERWIPRSSGMADHLMAIKWIGNDASHGDEVSFDSIYEAFEIIERVVNHIYSTEEHRIRRVVKRINQKKKPNSTLKKIHRS